MSANTALNVTGLSFDTIRANLRNFISAKPDFADFDFDDSAIGTLLDLLAFNTYYNAFYVNMAASEAFLDSAQFYDNVVSRAKMLDYVPTSARGATANVRISFTTATANASSPTLSIPQNTKFTSTINGVAYTFVTPKSYLVSANSSNRFRQDVELVEGVPLTHRFAYSTSNTSFILPNKYVDVRSIDVTITSGANTDTYTKVSDILTVNSSSNIFYVEADRNNKYKISFGDNVFGHKPPYNSTVSVSYRVCNALKGNGANNFTAVGTVAGQSNFTLRCLERAAGGAEQESIESIKFNAPKLYQIQNRAVVNEDYKRIILKNNTDLEAVNVWGGEENVPPIYGKVYIAAKPFEGNLISSSRKAQIKTEIKKYNLGPIDIEMVDPTFLYIKPTVNVEYDSRLTSLSSSQIATAVANRIIVFEENNFSRFDSNFWLSKFLNYIDLTDKSIVGTTATIELEKKFLPSTTSTNTYTFSFNTILDKSGIAESSDQPLGWLSSSGFTYRGFTSYLEDNSFGDVRVYYRDPTTNQRIYASHQVIGSINYETGVVTLDGFSPTAFVGDELKIIVKPKYPNVQAIRNQLLFFVDASVTVTEINNAVPVTRLTTIATQGESNTLNESGTITLTY